ncbi:uncharacterized protein LOC6594425 [Drosophila persimilis]|uniref:uncharacterized protein LOC6594425 n=1 Tax=Drosophila persimilis TaxID=7234 RepID=UPI000F073C73|nr:uncharacterized protein LOC6594425 [Drosophila persimilis]
MNCVVLNCQNATRGSERNHDMYFFKFPKNADLAKRWLSFCGNKHALGMKNACICIKHFKDEDIVGLEKFKSGWTRHVSLGLNAVPCIHVKKKSMSETSQNVEETVYNIEETAHNVEETEFEEFQTIPNNDCPEANAGEADEGNLTQFNKCRTCYRDYKFDLDEEDPFAEANSMLLFRIEVICGVWLSKIKGGPRYMCPDCQLSLKNAIEFREKVISTEVMLTQGRPVCDKPAVEVESVATETGQGSSAPEWTSELVSINTEEDDEEYTQYEHIYDVPSSPSFNKIDHIVELETIEENIDVANADSFSVACGTKILNEMINDNDKHERTKNETKAEKPTKERAKPRKMKIQARRQDDDEDDSEFIIFGAFDKKMKLSATKSPRRTSFKRRVRGRRVENK